MRIKFLQVHLLVISCDRVEECALNMSQEKRTGMGNKCVQMESSYLDKDRSKTLQHKEI